MNAGAGPDIHGVDANGYWARTIRRFGHTVRLMSPQFVKP